MAIPPKSRPQMFFRLHIRTPTTISLKFRLLKIAACMFVGLQYNTIQHNWSLTSPFFFMHAKLRNALSRLGGADAMVLQSIVVEELAQGSWVAARAEFESATLRTRGNNSTTEPPRPIQFPAIPSSTHLGINI